MRDRRHQQPPPGSGARRRGPGALLLALPFLCLPAVASSCVYETANSNAGAANSNARGHGAVGNANVKEALAVDPQPATPSPSPHAQASPTPVGGPTPQGTPAASTGTLQLPLLVPVAGVRPEDLRDTYTQTRSEGRAHNAIDIMAPRGTPVLAAADGKIVKLFNSVPGGITVYQLATDGKTILYYAHLDRYAEGLAEGHFARRGETIGYVGDTGNSGAGNYHLHFSVTITADPKRWWGGTNINPYPLLGGRPPE